MAASHRTNAMARRICRPCRSHYRRWADLALLPLAFALALPTNRSGCAALLLCCGTAAMTTFAYAQAIGGSGPLGPALGFDDLTKAAAIAHARTEDIDRAATLPVGAARPSPPSKSASAPKTISPDGQVAMSADKSRHSCLDMNGDRFEWSSSNVPFASHCDARPDIK
jgi:hypothetical protein